MTRVVKSLLVG
uniref:Uncharacterized protein n=1 Tax=Arundo donax TaxID=35708 RepID=A0A0A8YFZ8_ARUDO